jgi:hypothetical protein
MDSVEDFGMPRNASECLGMPRNEPFLGITRDRMFKRLWSPGIDFKEIILPAYVAWRAGTKTLFLLGS